MVNRVRLYTQAGTYEFPVHAMDAINLTIGLDHEIRLRALEARLGINLDAQWMAPRSLSVARGDDAVGDRAEPETPPVD